MTDAIYRRAGDAFAPSELSRGPWDPGAQHGGPPAALLARAVEAVRSERPMHVARMTVELLRPVPIAPVAVECAVVRPGRRVQLVQASLHSADGSTELVRATALRVSAVPGDAPPIATEAILPPRAGDGRPFHADAPGRFPYATFGDAFEVEPIRGRFFAPGPAAYWFRLTVPLVAGEETSPLCRVMATADFGSGVGSVLHDVDLVSINPDLTVYLQRPPVGEWLALDSSTAVVPAAGALTATSLHDDRGPIGHAIQALYVGPR